jgi:hypothetical protein
MIFSKVALAVAVLLAIGATQVAAQKGGPAWRAQNQTLECMARASKMFRNPFDPRRKAFLKRCNK